MTKIPYAMAIGNWLPYSETFIYDQVKHAKKFEPSNRTSSPAA